MRPSDSLKPVRCAQEKVKIIADQVWSHLTKAVTKDTLHVQVNRLQLRLAHHLLVCSAAYEAACGMFKLPDSLCGQYKRPHQIPRHYPQSPLPVAPGRSCLFKRDLPKEALLQASPLTVVRSLVTMNSPLRYSISTLSLVFWTKAGSRQKGSWTVLALQ